MSNQHNSNESPSSPAQISAPAAPCLNFPYPLGTLTALPLELRQQIYPYALEESPALTRTSKAIYAETQPLLYQHGIYSMFITVDRKEPWPVHWYLYDTAPWQNNCTDVITRPENLCTTLPGTLANIQNFQINMIISEPAKFDSGRITNTMRPAWPLSKATEAIFSETLKPQRGHVKFTFGGCYELFHEGENLFFEGAKLMKSSISNLVNFEELEIELCERPWVHRYPEISGLSMWKRVLEDETALSEAQVVGLFKGRLQKGAEDGKKIRIVRSSVEAEREDVVLWENP